MGWEKKHQTTTDDKCQVTKVGYSNISVLQKHIGAVVPELRPEKTSLRKLAETVCFKSMSRKLALWPGSIAEAVGEAKFNFLSVSKEWNLKLMWLIDSFAFICCAVFADAPMLAFYKRFQIADLLRPKVAAVIDFGLHREPAGFACLVCFASWREQLQAVSAVFFSSFFYVYPLIDRFLTQRWVWTAFLPHGAPMRPWGRHSEMIHEVWSPVCLLAPKLGHFGTVLSAATWEVWFEFRQGRLVEWSRQATWWPRGPHTDPRQNEKLVFALCLLANGHQGQE